MGLNTSPLSYEDVRELMQRALDSPKGLRVTLSSPAEAINMRARMNKFRANNRKDNKKIYTPDHPMWGNSVFDALVTRIDRENPKVILVEKASLENLKWEEL